MRRWLQHFSDPSRFVRGVYAHTYTYIGILKLRALRVPRTLSWFGHGCFGLIKPGLLNSVYPHTYMHAYMHTYIHTYSQYVWARCTDVAVNVSSFWAGMRGPNVKMPAWQHAGIFGGLQIANTLSHKTKTLNHDSFSGSLYL